MFTESDALDIQRRAASYKPPTGWAKWLPRAFTLGIMANFGCIAAFAAYWLMQKAVMLGAHFGHPIDPVMFLLALIAVAFTATSYARHYHP